MRDHIERILAQGQRAHELEPPATKEDIAELIRDAPFEMPAAYLAFLSVHNGGSGELPVQPCWYELWPANKVMEYNADYEVAQSFPDCLAIGSNQGGELIYLDFRVATKGQVMSVPLIPSDLSYAILIAPSFDELVPLLGLECECD